MKFACQVTQLNNGDWSVRHSGSDVGTAEVTAGLREEALLKMRNEIRYRLEICPCTGEMYQQASIEIVETSGH